MKPIEQVADFNAHVPPNALCIVTPQTGRSYEGRTETPARVQAGKAVVQINNRAVPLETVRALQNWKR